MPGEQVDGMDVLAVREAGRRAVERARREKRADAHRDADLSVPGPLHARPGRRPSIAPAKRSTSGRRSDPIVLLWDG